MLTCLRNKLCSFTLFTILCLGTIAVHAAVIEREALPPGGLQPICPPPRVSCDGECCTAGHICSASLTCVPKPPPPLPPKAGSLSISWYTDRAGHPNMIYIHGRNFTAGKGAAVSILEDWITYTSGGSPEYNELMLWSMSFPESDFDYAPGIQDCSRAGSPGAGQFGEPATVQTCDWAINPQGGTTAAIPFIKVRTQFGGLCTANEG